jgi:hypothetical protein
MKTDPAGTRFPHLDLADLIAEATGQAVGDQAREHLASCEHCQLEARRWNLVAGGVRGLTTAAPEAARPARTGQETRHTRSRLLTGRRRGVVLVASAAAAGVLLAAIGYALVPRPSSGTVLTAVSGCAPLEQARGSLEQVNGTSLVITTSSGQPVRVTTTAATTLIVSGWQLTGIPDGAPVVVAGTRSGGPIAATLVIVRPSFTVRMAPQFVTVKGTVTDASAAGFTVVTSAGTRVPVTVSTDTVVSVAHVGPNQLPVGATVLAVGHAEPNGTLQATMAAAIVQRSSGPQIGGQYHGTAQGCSPGTLLALATALVSSR